MEAIVDDACRTADEAGAAPSGRRPWDLHPALTEERLGHCHVVWGPSKFDREAEFA